MFARKLFGFSLACLLAASTAFAFEESGPKASTDGAQPALETEGTSPATAADHVLDVDKFVPDETLASGTDADTPADVES